MCVAGSGGDSEARTVGADHDDSGEDKNDETVEGEDDDEGSSTSDDEDGESEGETDDDDDDEEVNSGFVPSFSILSSLQAKRSLLLMQELDTFYPTGHRSR